MAKLQPMITASQPDELMIITAVYDHDARKKSYSLLADAFGLGEEGGGVKPVVTPRRTRSIDPGNLDVLRLTQLTFVAMVRVARNDGNRQSCVSLNVARNGWPG